MSTPVDLGNVQPGTFQVSASEAIDAAPVGAGYWRVTVAAQVLGAPHTDGGNATTIGSSTTVPASAYLPLGERCYLVAVETRGGGFVAPVVPSQIACPTAARAAPSVFGQAGVPTPDDPATVAVTQFLAVMLTGPADTMGRYLAPGAAVAAITPPPFTTVTVTGVPCPADFTLKIENGRSVTVVIRKMIVNPASRMFSAISLGVFCRLAPSTIAIMRSRNVSPGLTLMRTTSQSLRKKNL